MTDFLSIPAELKKKLFCQYVLNQPLKYRTESLFGVRWVSKGLPIENEALLDTLDESLADSLAVYEVYQDQQHLLRKSPQEEYWGPEDSEEAEWEAMAEAMTVYAEAEWMAECAAHEEEEKRRLQYCKGISSSTCT
eukprot:Nitzschia sp. Nitz4//scaffold499_size4626//427//834//NITZ4_009237-RA/size4626-processed-gene-0.0-mRNA-1//-1//CDS//3329553094//2138//frame0